ERVGQVLRVTIDHPSSALNAVDDRLHHDLTALFAGLKRESEARAVLLTGRGRAFSAGGDFAWFPALQEPGRLEALRRHAKRLIWLVTRVVPAAELDALAMAFAARLAAGAPLAVRYTKLAVNKLVKDALNVAFDTSTALELLTFRSEDHQEALAALREKRPPVFKGR